MTRFGDVRRMRWRGKESRNFYVRIYDYDTMGKPTRKSWRCTGYSDRDLAELQVHAWRRAQIEAQASPPVNDVLLADAVNQWIAERTIGHSRKYVLLLRYLAGRWSRRWPKRAVGALREDDIVAHLRASWESEHLGASTLNTEIRCLRAFLSWSVARRYAREVPAAALKRFPVPERVPRTITTEEEERLLQAAASCGEFAFAYVLCLCQTGFRSGLVHALRWEWVDLARGVWDIPQGVTKSKRAFCQPIAGALLDWLQARKEPAGEIFWGRNLHDSWREIRDSAGLPGLRRHDLRRTFVTRCRRAGVDLEACMALSDHHCVRTMLRIYRSVQVDETRGALRKMFGR